MSHKLVQFFSVAATDRGLSLREVCQKAGVAQNTLPAVSNGNKSMYTNSVQFILRVINGENPLGWSDKVRLANILLGTVPGSRYAKRTKRKSPSKRAVRSKRRR